MVKPRFDYGDSVRVTRNVRNDGTFPGSEVGELLVRRGSVGYVQDRGAFLQDQIIYSVHFLGINRIIGCREGELIGVDEAWVASRFEFRDKVVCRKALAVEGRVIVGKGARGEIQKVLCDMPEAIHYHVRFPGRTLQVPEAVLKLATSVTLQAGQYHDEQV